MSTDPYRAYNFQLLLDGELVAGFVECSGLGADIPTIDYREGGSGHTVRHLPGRVRYQPATLRHGISRSRQLWDWFQGSIAGTPARRDVSLLMLDNDGITPAFRWNLFDAWVSQWKAAALEANSNEIAIETLTIVYDRLERD